MTTKTRAMMFEEKVTAEPTTGCFLWSAGVAKRGYGKFTVDGRTVLAHRYAWEQINGPVPTGMCVLHRCDTPSCVNPAHLFVGTHAENSADMVQKNRQARGERQHLSKLSANDVLTIRGAWNSGIVTQQQLADAFGVAQTGISKIVKRETWKHI